MELHFLSCCFGFFFFSLNDTSLTRPGFEILENLGYRAFHAEPNFFFVDKMWEVGYIHESLVSS